MEKSKINELIEKYNLSIANADEILLVENLIEQGKVALTDLVSLSVLNEKLSRQPELMPSIELDHKFYEMLAKEKRKSTSITFSFPDWIVLFPRLALACSLLIAGFLCGYLFQKPSATSEVKQLTLQVEDLKEMMMISLLEKESATERLKAVSLTQEINDPSQQVTKALLKTLNSDANVNVRLSALDALQGYSNLPHVREGLVRSIALQESPLVQVALAELMVAIQEKSSVSELKKVLEQQQTPKEVKEKIKKSIEVLI
jgi:HEAT repeats